MNSIYSLRQAIDLVEDFKRYAYGPIHGVRIRAIDNIPDEEISMDGLVVDPFDETQVDPSYNQFIECYLNTNAILTRFENGVRSLTIPRVESRMEVFERTSVYLDAWVALIQLGYPKVLVPSDDLVVINNFLDWLTPTLDENRINREKLVHRNTLADMLGGNKLVNADLKTYVPINRKQVSAAAQRQIAKTASENMLAKFK